MLLSWETRLFLHKQSLESGRGKERLTGCPGVLRLRQRPWQQRGPCPSQICIESLKALFLLGIGFLPPEFFWRVQFLRSTGKVQQTSVELCEFWILRKNSQPRKPWNMDACGRTTEFSPSPEQREKIHLVGGSNSFYLTFLRKQTQAPERAVITFNIWLLSLVTTWTSLSQLMVFPGSLLVSALERSSEKSIRFDLCVEFAGAGKGMSCVSLCTLNLVPSKWFQSASSFQTTFLEEGLSIPRLKWEHLLWPAAFRVWVTKSAFPSQNRVQTGDWSGAVAKVSRCSSCLFDVWTTLKFEVWAFQFSGIWNRKSPNLKSQKRL